MSWLDNIPPINMKPYNPLKDAQTRVLFGQAFYNAGPEAVNGIFSMLRSWLDFQGYRADNGNIHPRSKCEAIPMLFDMANNLEKEIRDCIKEYEQETAVSELMRPGSTLPDLAYRNNPDILIKDKG